MFVSPDSHPPEIGWVRTRWHKMRPGDRFLLPRPPCCLSVVDLRLSPITGLLVGPLAHCMCWPQNPVISRASWLAVFACGFRCRGSGFGSGCPSTSGWPHIFWLGVVACVRFGWSAGVGSPATGIQLSEIDRLGIYRPRQRGLPSTDPDWFRVSACLQSPEQRHEHHRRNHE